MGQSVRRARNPYVGVGRVKFTVGAEAGNVIKVTASLKAPSQGSVAPSARQFVRAWLTQSLTTLAPAATAPDGAVAVAGKGSILNTPTAKLVFDVACDANGEFDLNVTNSTAATYYLCVEVGGEVFVSPAVAFA